jgi:hypothetical protein
VKLLRSTRRRIGVKGEVQVDDPQEREYRNDELGRIDS